MAKPHVAGDSPTSKREKSVVLTARGIDYLRVQRTAAQTIDADLRAELGETAITSLFALLEALDQTEQTRLRTYLQRSAPT